MVCALIELVIDLQKCCCLKRSFNIFYAYNNFISFLKNKIFYKNWKTWKTQKLFFTKLCGQCQKFNCGKDTLFFLYLKEDSLDFKTKQVKWFATVTWLLASIQLDRVETWKEILHPVAVEGPKMPVKKKGGLWGFLYNICFSLFLVLVFAIYIAFHLRVKFCLGLGKYLL